MAEVPLAQGIDRFKQNEDRMDRFTNGSDTQSFVTSGGQAVPTIRKFLKDKDTEINDAANGILSQTKAVRDATMDIKEDVEELKDQSAQSAQDAAQSAANAALFDPSSYYTKTQTDDKYYTKTQAEEQNYTKTQSDDRYYTKSQMDITTDALLSNVLTNASAILLIALELADLKGQRLGMTGGVADPFDDQSGVNTPVAVRLTGSTPSGLVSNPANINDNNPATNGSWTGSNLGSTNFNSRKLAQLDFGSLKTITKIEAVGYYQASGGNSLAGFYYSSDGVNWAQLGSNVAVTTTPTTFSVTGAVKARYVALLLGAVDYTGTTAILQDLNAYSPSVDGFGDGNYDATNGWFKPLMVGGETSYLNAGGMGNRNGMITITSVGLKYVGGTPANTLVNGNLSDDVVYLDYVPQSGYIQFDFGEGNRKYIDQFTFFQAPSYAGAGPWSWSGSNDGINFTTLLASFSLASGSPLIINIPPHMTTYRYFRLSVNGGAGAGYLNEINFRISSTAPSYAGMTIRSVPYVAAAAPKRGRIVVQLQEIDPITPNTDLIARMSRNGGAAWATGVLSRSPSPLGPTMLEASDIDLTGMSEGSSMLWEVFTASGKNVAVSGVVAQWRQ